MRKSLPRRWQKRFTKFLLLLLIITLPLLSSAQVEGEPKNQFDAAGKPVGLWITSYDNGEYLQRRQGHYKNGLLDGVWIYYNRLGEEAYMVTYKMGKKNGIEKQYFSDEGPLQYLTNWKDGFKDGECIEYFIQDDVYDRLSAESRKFPLKVRERSMYARGILEGRSQSYYLNGQLKYDVWYHKGRWHGDHISYKEDGQIKSKAKYNNGKQVYSYDF